MGSESIAHEAQGMRVRGIIIIVLVKIQLVGQKYWNKKKFS